MIDVPIQVGDGERKQRSEILDIIKCYTTIVECVGPGIAEYTDGLLTLVTLISF